MITSSKVEIEFSSWEWRRARLRAIQGIQLTLEDEKQFIPQMVNQAGKLLIPPLTQQGDMQLMKSLQNPCSFQGLKLYLALKS